MGNREEGVAYRELREFVEKLEKEGELRRIRAEVDPILEIAEVVQRMRDKGGREAIPQGLKPHSQGAANVEATDKVGGGASPAPHSTCKTGGLFPPVPVAEAKWSPDSFLSNVIGSLPRV